MRLGEFNKRDFHAIYLYRLNTKSRATKAGNVTFPPPSAKPRGAGT